MATPGFDATASLYSSLRYYSTVFGLDAGSQGALPALPKNGGGNGGGPHCKPHCSKCLPDSSVPTGCSQACVDSLCDWTSEPCTGCVSCQPGFSACPNGACVDLNNDMQNCSSCGHTCPAGSTSCQGGICYPTPRVCGQCTKNCDVVCCDGGAIVRCYPNSQTNSDCTTQCCYEVAPGQQSCSLTPCACL